MSHCQFKLCLLFCIYCHFIKMCLSHRVSATKKPLSWSQKWSKIPFFWPANVSFAQSLPSINWKQVSKKCHIVNLNYVFFFAFIAILLKCVCHTESVRQRNHWVGHKNGKNTLFLTSQCFLCCADSLQQTSSKEMTKNTKKGDMIKTKMTVLRKLD